PVRNAFLRRFRARTCRGASGPTEPPGCQDTDLHSSGLCNISGTYHNPNGASARFKAALSQFVRTKGFAPDTILAHPPPRSGLHGRELLVCRVECRMALPLFSESL